MTLTDKNRKTYVNRPIGDVGLDRITLTHLIDQRDPFPEPVKQMLIDPSVVSAEIPDHGITASRKKIKVHGPGYTFSYGNQGDRPFTKIELHASREGEDNLCNMRIRDVWDRLDAAVKDLQTTVDAGIRYDRDQVRVYSAEINCTVPLDRPYADYGRIVRLMTAVCRKPAMKRAEVTGQAGIETTYLMAGRTKTIKVYDKSKDLEQTYGIDCDCSLLRFEMTGTEQTLSAMSANKDDRTQGHYQLHLRDFDASNLYDFFNGQIKDIFAKIDAYLDGNLRCAGEAGIAFEVMADTAIRQSLRNGAAFVDQMLQSIYFREKQNGTPELLDIEDLINAINKSQLKQTIRETIIGFLQEARNNPAAYSAACHTYVGQRGLYDELKRKLTVAPYGGYEILLKQIAGEDRLIWWDNPRHQQIETDTADENGKSSPDATTVYGQLIGRIRACFPSEAWEENAQTKYDLYRTSNAKPIVYAKRVHYYIRDDGTRIVEKGAEVGLIKDSFWDAAKAEAAKRKAECEKKIEAEKKAESERLRRQWEEDKICITEQMDDD